MGSRGKMNLYVVVAVNALMREDTSQGALGESGCFTVKDGTKWMLPPLHTFRALTHFNKISEEGC